MLEGRGMWSTAPPAPRDRMQNQPTLLFSWWCSSFSAAIILTRICGRKIRSNELFREDWIMLVALAPLFIRMALIHFVLIYRTNNVETVGHSFSPEDLIHRSIGSKLVLAARISYAMFIWFCKLTVSEFLKRITIRIWRPAYEMTLRGIRVFLLITFFAVVIATLTECRPFDHYWQVIPDPGLHCRLGYAHLLTMGTCDVITDVLLILFPIPIVLKSGQTWQRKLQLVSLFSLSIVMIGITVTRMTMVVRHGGLQQYRTVWASCEILASSSACNAVILGSFIRDKGTKRNRYVSYSVSDSIDRVSTRRTTLNSYGSDEELFRSVGLRLPEGLQDQTQSTPRPAPMISPSGQFSPVSLTSTNEMMFRASSNLPMPGCVLGRVLPSPSISTNHSISLSDTTGHLEGVDGDSQTHIDRPLRMVPSDSSVIAYDFAADRPAHGRQIVPINSSQEETVSPTQSSGTITTRRSLRFMQHQRVSRVPPVGIRVPILERHETEQSLQDAGGLLRSISHAPTTPHYFNPWSELNMDLSRSITLPTPVYADPGQTSKLEDVGGLLPGEVVTALERTTKTDHVSSPASPS